MKPPVNSRLRWLFTAGAIALALMAEFVVAQTPLDEDTPWPRVRSVSNQTVTLHLPEVERWTSNSFTARAVVEVKSARAKEGVLGVVWFEARGRVDRSNRVVTLERQYYARSLAQARAKPSRTSGKAVLYLHSGGRR